MDARDAGRGIVLVIAAVLAGCALGGPRRRAAPEAGKEAALYWADLGPDRVDVSSYPDDIKRDYETYAVVCSRCHTLARSVNAPVAGRAYWEMYVLGMRMISRSEKNEPITKEQQKAILDFLEFDSQRRKVDDAAAFRKQTDELKRRFEPILRERMRRLQESRQPVILSPG